MTAHVAMAYLEGQREEGRGNGEGAGAGFAEAGEIEGRRLGGLGWFIGCHGGGWS